MAVHTAPTNQSGCSFGTVPAGLSRRAPLRDSTPSPCVRVSPAGAVPDLRGPRTRVAVGATHRAAPAQADDAQALAGGHRAALTAAGETETRPEDILRQVGSRTAKGYYEWD